MGYEHSLSFIAKIRKRDGRMKIEFSKDERLLVQDVLDFWKMRGGVVQFTLSRPVKPRTVGVRSQQSHINGHCQQLAVETGQPFPQVKREMKYLAISRGYPILYDEEGNLLLDEYGREQGISEASANTVEAGFLIDAIHQYADEEGITLIED
ncbi:MAG: hypothetical protein PQJ59_01695 [Spirochaetales bacterium]|nr:hypothetical protein [Spirochaetales bacterium]